MRYQEPHYRLTDRELEEHYERQENREAKEEWAAEKNMGLDMEANRKPRTVIEAYGRLRRAFRSYKEAKRKVSGLSDGSLIMDGMTALKTVNEADFRRMCLDKAKADYRQVKGKCDGKNL